MTTVVVSGALANRPGNGGGADVRMTWVAGLRRLGCDVWFVEQLADPLRERAARRDGEGADPIRYFERVCGAHGLGGRCALLDGRGAALSGVTREAIDAAADAAALLVNLGGHLRVPSLLARFRRKAYVDLDPGFTQIWHASGSSAAALAGHDAYFTVGLNVGAPGCGVPVDGIRWRPLPPPVVLEEWPVEAGGLGAFTTVASWRGPFAPLEHGGRRLGVKAHALRKLIDLPAHVAVPMEMALDIHPGDSRDLEALRTHGWRIVDPAAAAPDPAAYRRYIASSGAEFSVAQEIYVETASGWLSDRTVRYLAAGRPVLVQETGARGRFAAEGGWLTFRDRAEAIAGAERIAADYAAHRARARELAETHFDSDRVLGRFLDEAGAGG